MAAKQVLQFSIILLDTDPVIWRRIQVPEQATFWDLHVAIQDAMGWKDCHLHHFNVNHSIQEGKKYIGIQQDSEHDVLNTMPGQMIKVTDYLIINDVMIYEYDFGDSWTHQIIFEGYHKAKANQKYPICLDGERACPPEDVGGIPGFEHFLEAISDPNHEEHEDFLNWLEKPYDPAAFSPKAVKFENPTKRWKQAFETA